MRPGISTGANQGGLQGSRVGGTQGRDPHSCTLDRTLHAAWWLPCDWQNESARANSTSVLILDHRPGADVR